MNSSEADQPKTIKERRSERHFTELMKNREKPQTLTIQKDPMFSVAMTPMIQKSKKKTSQSS